jgi:hypothetical protein
MTFQALHAVATIEIIHLFFEQKKVRADDVRRHHHHQHQQLPSEYL